MPTAEINKLFLLTTCGTSILNKLAEDEDEKSWLSRHSNDANVRGADSELLRKLLMKAKDRLAASNNEERRKVSAELNGIYACKQKWNPASTQHILLHSDTAFGRGMADVLKSILAEEGSPAQLMSAGGLRTDSAVNFRTAISDLTKQIWEYELATWRNEGYLIVFNLTGGFKSVNAYVQTLGLLYADRCVFIFEGAQELMEIPRLPIRLDLKEAIKMYLDAFRRLDAGYKVYSTEVQSAPESLFLEIDGEVIRSTWADAEWARIRGEIFGEKLLLPPLSARVSVSRRLVEEFTHLERDKKLQVNEALDDFCGWLDNGKPLPKSRTFKALKGNPTPPSTYELYAWSDNDARRLFGHYEEGKFVFDRLGKHL